MTVIQGKDSRSRSYLSSPRLFRVDFRLNYFLLRFSQGPEGLLIGRASPKRKTHAAHDSYYIRDVLGDIEPWGVRKIREKGDF